MIRARSTTGVSAHFGRASAATLTTSSASAAVQNGTRAMTLPVEGLKASPKRVVELFFHCPPIRLETVVTCPGAEAAPVAAAVVCITHISLTDRFFLSATLDRLS